VLDCNGSGLWSGVIAGINWVTEHHGAGAAVANMSLGGGAIQSVDDAVAASIADGVTYSVSAGLVSGVFPTHGNPGRARGGT
jgi:hypothetical protein